MPLTDLVSLYSLGVLMTTLTLKTKSFQMLTPSRLILTLICRSLLPFMKNLRQVQHFQVATINNIVSIKKTLEKGSHIIRLKKQIWKLTCMVYTLWFWLKKKKPTKLLVLIPMAFFSYLFALWFREIRNCALFYLWNSKSRCVHVLSYESIFC